MATLVQRDAMCANCGYKWVAHRWGKCPDDSGRMFAQAPSGVALLKAPPATTPQAFEQLKSPTLPYEEVNHPEHYGGEDNPYEVIKIVEHYNLGFNLGNTVKYILRCGKKPGVEVKKDLQKALWYLQREINKYTS